MRVRRLPSELQGHQVQRSDEQPHDGAPRRPGRNVGADPDPQASRRELRDHLEQFCEHKDVGAALCELEGTDYWDIIILSAEPTANATSRRTCPGEISSAAATWLTPSIVALIVAVLTVPAATINAEKIKVAVGRSIELAPRVALFAAFFAVVCCCCYIASRAQLVSYALYAFLRTNWLMLMIFFVLISKIARMEMFEGVMQDLSRLCPAVPIVVATAASKVARFYSYASGSAFLRLVRMAVQLVFNRVAASFMALFAPAPAPAAAPAPPAAPVVAPVPPPTAPPTPASRRKDGRKSVPWDLKYRS